MKNFNTLIPVEAVKVMIPGMKKNLSKLGEFILYHQDTFLSTGKRNGPWLHHRKNSNYNTTTIGKVMLDIIPHC